jgi:hypothetical protein
MTLAEKLKSHRHQLTPSHRAMKGTSDDSDAEKQAYSKANDFFADSGAGRF